MPGECYEYTPFSGYNLSDHLLPVRKVCARRVAARWPSGRVMTVSGHGDASLSLTMMEHMFYMGFTIDWKGSAPWPAGQVSYLGLALDSTSVLATFAGVRWESDRDCALIARPWSPGSVRDAC